MFLEVNARLQVEHTVTEEITGVDLVQAQLRIAGGASLAELGLTQDRIPAPRGVSVQARVNAETLYADGTAAPSTGTITVYDVPSGPGIRVDGAGWTGGRVSARYDPLLAKVIAWSPEADPAFAIARAARAVQELRVEGVATNAALLAALLARPELPRAEVTTTFVDDHLAELVPAAATASSRRAHQPSRRHHRRRGCAPRSASRTRWARRYELRRRRIGGAPRVPVCEHLADPLRWNEVGALERDASRRRRPCRVGGPMRVEVLAVQVLPPVGHGAPRRRGGRRGRRGSSASPTTCAPPRSGGTMVWVNTSRVVSPSGVSSMRSWSPFQVNANTRSAPTR